MSDWRSNYKSMTAEQISAEYQRLLTNQAGYRPDLADRLNFLKQEFRIKVKP
jgi:hypothetical protein